MKTIKIDSSSRRVDMVHLDIPEPRTGRDDQTRQDDSAIRRSMGVTKFDPEPFGGEAFDDSYEHALLVDPRTRHELDGPAFYLDSAPDCPYGGPAYILGYRGGFFVDVRMTLEEAQNMVRFLTEDERVRFIP